MEYLQPADELYTELCGILSSEYFDTAPERFQSINILERALKNGHKYEDITEKMREFKRNTNRTVTPKLNQMILNNFWLMTFRKHNHEHVPHRAYNPELDM
jgi:hypothetical protein